MVASYYLYLLYFRMLGQTISRMSDKISVDIFASIVSNAVNINRFDF